MLSLLQGNKLRAVAWIFDMAHLLAELTPSFIIPLKFLSPVRVKSPFKAFVPAYWRLKASPLFAQSLRN